MAIVHVFTLLGGPPLNLQWEGAGVFFLINNFEGEINNLLQELFYIYTCNKI